MYKFKSLNSRLLRTFFLSAAAALFAASGLIFNTDRARMQSGSNTIAFDRTDTSTHTSKVFVMDADGTNVTELASGSDPVYSPDGTKIAYTSGDGETSDIWVMNADGSEQRQLTQVYQAFSAAWSPDGSQIAFGSSHENGYQIYAINSDGTNLRRIDSGDPNMINMFYPAWSVDGSRIYFVGNRPADGLSQYDIFAANADGSGALMQLTYGNKAGNTSRLAVDPDGTRIVCKISHNLQSVATDGSGAVSVIANGGGSLDRDPAFSPNGAKIAFTRGEYINIMDRDGANAASLDVAGRNPSWNPTAVLPAPSPTATVTPTPSPSPTPAQAADLSVDITASASETNMQGVLTYTITVTNNGADAAGGVRVYDTLSDGSGFVQVRQSQGVCFVGGNPLYCELGTIDANAQASVTVQVVHNQAGQATSAANVESDTTDPDPTNNAKSISINVLGGCAQPISIPFEVTRTQWRRIDHLGQDELILTIRNRSAQSVNPRMVFVFDNLPAGVSIDPGMVGGYTQCAAPLNSPYLIAYAPNKKEWKPMQTVSVRVLFNNPSRAGIPYDWRLYNSSQNP